MSGKSLSNALQAIIDNRLDAIDQNLLRAGIPRHQRRSIGEEVENQILEMLTRLEHDEWTREDVLTVLARLDPPEAYGVGVPPSGGPPEPPAGGSPTFRGVRAAASQAMQRVRAEWRPAWAACFAAGLGVFTLLLTLAYLAAIDPSHDSALLGLLLLMLMAGAATLLGGWSFYYLRQKKEPKFAVVAALFATLLYPLLLLNGLLLAIGIATYPVSVGLLAVLLFAGINAALGRLCWRWATRKPAEKPAAAKEAPLIIMG